MYINCIVLIILYILKVIIGFSRNNINADEVCDIHYTIHLYVLLYVHVMFMVKTIGGGVMGQ